MKKRKRKKSICIKCNKYYHCETHHILPQGLFGKNKETVNLCSNCHTKAHLFLGYKYLHKENKKPMEFYFLAYYKWLFLTVITIFFILIY